MLNNKRKCVIHEITEINNRKLFSTGSCRSGYSSKSFLFSLYNINGYAPVKMNIMSGYYRKAQYIHMF